MMVYYVTFIDHRSHGEDGQEPLGIFNDIRTAIAAAEDRCKNEDDEAFIREFVLNAHQLGKPVWSNKVGFFG